MKNRSKATNTAGIAARICDVSELEDDLSVVLYGRSSTGKTTLAADFPGPALLIDANDRGTASVRDKKGLKVIRCETWLDIEQTYWYLKKHPTKFKTVILDTVSMMQVLLMRHHLEEKGGSKNGGMMTKKDWGEISGVLLVWLMNFRDLEGINKVFIAQDKVKGGSDEDDDEDGQIAPEVGPRLMPSVAVALNAAVDIIGNTFVREKWKKTMGKDKKIVKERKVHYCLRIGPHAYYTTKVRKPKSIEVPDFIVNPTYQKLVDNLKE